MVMLDALFEIVGRILVEFLFYTVSYWVGWLMLKVITLGHYPPQKPARHSEELVAIFPIASLFVGLAFMFS